MVVDKKCRISRFLQQVDFDCKQSEANSCRAGKIRSVLFLVLSLPLFSQIYINSQIQSINQLHLCMKRHNNKSEADRREINKEACFTHPGFLSVLQFNLSCVRHVQPEVTQLWMKYPEATRYQLSLSHSLSLYACLSASFTPHSLSLRNVESVSGRLQTLTWNIFAFFSTAAHQCC